MTLLRTEVLKRQSIDSAMCRLNAKLCADNPTSMFATLIIRDPEQAQRLFPVCQCRARSHHPG
jgi:hypothetical protein